MKLFGIESEKSAASAAARSEGNQSCRTVKYGELTIKRDDLIGCLFESTKIEESFVAPQANYEQHSIIVDVENMGDELVLTLANGVKINQIGSSDVVRRTIDFVDSRDFIRSIGF